MEHGRWLLGFAHPAELLSTDRLRSRQLVAGHDGIMVGARMAPFTEYNNSTLYQSRMLQLQYIARPAEASSTSKDRPANQSHIDVQSGPSGTVTQFLFLSYR